jgi:hypothetical protein
VAALTDGYSGLRAVPGDADFVIPPVCRYPMLANERLKWLTQNDAGAYIFFADGATALSWQSSAAYVRAALKECPDIDAWGDRNFYLADARNDVTK